MQLDVFDLCESDLQQQLTPMRSKFKDDDDMKVDMVGSGLVEWLVGCIH